jgi:DNA-binding CsgD family transcriptional regulator
MGGAMTQGYMELWAPQGRSVVPLQTGRLSIGRGAANDIPLDDPLASRLHAVLEDVRGGWVVRDTGSTNGTYLNGRRVLGEAAVHPGDEIRVGETRLIFHSSDPGARDPSTIRAGQPPHLTRREKEVLVLLCGKVFSGSVFTQPASIREIAESLFVTEAAVKQHLGRLYDKFDIHEGRDRRVHLANEAIRRGAVTMAELEADSRSTIGREPQES